MDLKKQELITLVSDIKFTLTKLDPAYDQQLIDLLIDCTNELESHPTDYEPLINTCVNKIEKCISENNLKVPSEVPVLIKSFSAFIPMK